MPTISRRIFRRDTGPSRTWAAQRLLGRPQLVQVDSGQLDVDVAPGLEQRGRESLLHGAGDAAGQLAPAVGDHRTGHGSCLGGRQFDRDLTEVGGQFPRRDVARILATVSFQDERCHYGEERWIVYGTLADVFVNIVYTVRKDKIRIISMRKANSRERRKYEQTLKENTTSS